MQTQTRRVLTRCVNDNISVIAYSALIRQTVSMYLTAGIKLLLPEDPPRGYRLAQNLTRFRFKFFFFFSVAPCSIIGYTNLG